MTQQRAINAKGFKVVESVSLATRVELHLDQRLSEDELKVIGGLTPGTTVTEALGLCSVKLRAIPPPACGPDMAPAPARGAMRIVTPRRIEGNASVRDGYLGRSRMEVADVFDQMVQRAWDRHEADCARARKAGVADDKLPQFAPPFTAGQVSIARHYRALVEQHDAGGMKCASLEGRAGGGGQGGGFMDAFLDEGAEIDRLRHRIGNGMAMSLRRVRPSERGKRQPITARALVDGVCLAGKTVTEVLAAHGWNNDGRNRKVARGALAACLDRMQGYRSNEPQNVD